MQIGIPKEVKIQEGRVGLVPEAAAELVHQGHTVYLQSGAGALSGYSDDDYRSAGVSIVEHAEALYQSAALIVKVKEPVAADLRYIRKDHTLFCYLHLAANPDLTQALLKTGCCAVGFETVEKNGNLPLLAPMSDIAGRLAVHAGAQLLQHIHGGNGMLLGGLPGAQRGKVVILGAGSVGGNAARVAAAMGATVTVFARRREQQLAMRELGPNVTAVYPFHRAIEAELESADLLIGAVLVPGAKAPHIVSEDMVRRMRQGSVVVDVAVDQGGCIATTKATNYDDPTYVWEGVVHFAVTNMPGAVPRTASQALSSSLLPYASKIAQPKWQQNRDLSVAINVDDGKIVHSALKSAT